MEIIDGKKIRKEILEKIKEDISSLNFQPIFCDVLVGEDPASLQYVNMKAKTAEYLGIKFHKAFFPSTIQTVDLVLEIEKLNQIKGMCGIIIQLPLPVSIDKRIVLDAIDPELDVDGLGSKNSDFFYKGDSLEEGLVFPTALACVYILDNLNLNFSNKKVVVLGQGELVGKPVAKLLAKKNILSIAINSETKDKEEILKQADIIISGIGQAHYVKGGMLKKGVILIDAGTSEEGSGIVGDVEQDSVWSVASLLSPVPGGVGPVTVAMLFSNILKVAKKKNHE